MIKTTIKVIIILTILLTPLYINEYFGSLQLNYLSYRITISAAMLLIILISISMTAIILYNILLFILNTPKIFYPKQKNVTKGHNALITALINVASGDSTLARSNLKIAHKLLGNIPLINLIKAQIALNRQDHNLAISNFQSLISNKETRIIGIRSLIFHNYNQQDYSKILELTNEFHYQLQNQKSWLLPIKLEALINKELWQEAICAIKEIKSTNIKVNFNIQKQEGMCCQNIARQALAENNLHTALKMSKNALKLLKKSPDAICLHCSIFIKLQQEKRASKILLAEYARNPNIEVGMHYIQIEATPQAMLARSRKLFSTNSENPISHYLVAKHAFINEQYIIAKQHIIHAAQSIKNLETYTLLIKILLHTDQDDIIEKEKWLSVANDFCRLPQITENKQIGH